MKQWFRKLGSALFIVMLGGMLLELLYQLYSAWTYHVIYRGFGIVWLSYGRYPIRFWYAVLLCCLGTIMLTVAIPYLIWSYFNEEKYWRRREKSAPVENGIRQSISER